MTQTRDLTRSSTFILLTASTGAKCARQEGIAFSPGEKTQGRTLRVFPEIRKQIIEGIGSSFTEASAFVLAHLEKKRRYAVMQRIFGAEGANFTMARSPIGSCDFSVRGCRSYADIAGDDTLKHFSITMDNDGFDLAVYPGIKDATYDLLPMIHEAQQIKAAQGDKEVKIVASAWTAPPWMKDNDAWFIPASDINNWEGRGGTLKQEHYTTYARYLIEYLKSYQKEGVKLWGLTPVNEPCGNNGQWESLHFTPQQQSDFVKNHLGPHLHAQGFSDVRLLVYDQNRDHMEEWAETLFSDPETARYCYGLAVHWYSSTFKVYEETFNAIHSRFPTQKIIHTEGCIDDLGKDAPEGIGDPVRFKESGWFGNDDFWWNENATDWAYTADWKGVDADDHPIYTPVHRYARDIIVGLNNWVSGWIDWNLVLDRDGGPNHAGNFCGAPIMIDTDSGEVYFTPIFHVLSQFSRTIRPGDQAVKCELDRADLGKDDLHACATLNSEGLLSIQLLNTTSQPLTFNLCIGSLCAELSITANAVQTVCIQT